MSDVKEGEVKKKKLKKKIGGDLSFTVQKEVPYDNLEADEWYTAVLEGVTKDEGQYGPYLKFDWKILTGETESGKPAKDKKVSRIMDAVVAPGKPLGDWFKVFSGKDLEVGASLSLKPYIGCKYRVFITDKKAKKGQVLDKRYQLVEKIKRLVKEE